MMCYSVQPRDQIFVKGYGFLSFDKNVDKNIGQNINKNVSGKYSQELLNMLKNLQQMRLTLLQKYQFKKQQKQLVILIGNKIADRITKVSENLPQNDLWTISNEQDKETPKDRYTSSKEIQEIIDDLRLIQ